MSSLAEHIALLRQILAIDPKGWLSDHFHMAAASMCGAHLDEIESAVAQVGTHPKGGDAMQAPGDSLSDAVPEGDAP